MDIIFLLNRKVRIITNPMDWNSLCMNTEPGIIISPIILDERNINLNEVIGFPNRAYSYGCLVTFITQKITSAYENYKNAQIYIPHNGSNNDSSLSVYIRTFRDGNDVKTWRRFTPQNVVNANPTT